MDKVPVGAVLRRFHGVPRLFRRRRLSLRGWWNCDDGERLVELAICYDLMIRLLTGGYTTVESLEIASSRMETPGEYKRGLDIEAG